MSPSARTRLLALIALAVLGLLAAPSAHADYSDYQGAVAEDGPLGWWPLDDTSGANIGAAGSGINGSYQGGLVAGVSGAMEGSLATSFPSAGHVWLGSSAALQQSGEMALEAWFKTADASSGTKYIYRWAYYGALFYIGGPPSFGSMTGDGGGAGRVSFGFYNDNSTVYAHLNVVSSPTSYADGQWHHAVGVKTATQLRLYVDGQLSSQTSYTLPISYGVGGSQGAAIGRAAFIDQDYWAGQLDEVALYNTALSAERVLAHYQAALEASEPAQCQDGLDNDGDAYIDFPADPACASATDNDESPFNSPVSLPQCQDGLDNDGDLLIDFGFDPACSSPTDNDESPANVPVTPYNQQVFMASPLDAEAERLPFSINLLESLRGVNTAGDPIGYFSALSLATVEYMRSVHPTWMQQEGQDLLKQTLDQARAACKAGAVINTGTGAVPCNAKKIDNVWALWLETGLPTFSVDAHTLIHDVATRIWFVNVLSAPGRAAGYLTCSFAQDVVTGHVAKLGREPLERLLKQVGGKAAGDLVDCAGIVL